MRQTAREYSGERPGLGGSAEKVPRRARYREAPEGFDQGQSGRVQDNAARRLLVQQHALQVSYGYGYDE